MNLYNVGQKVLHQSVKRRSGGLRCIIDAAKIYLLDYRSLPLKGPLFDTYTFGGRAGSNSCPHSCRLKLCKLLHVNNKKNQHIISVKKIV